MELIIIWNMTIYNGKFVICYLSIFFLVKTFVTNYKLYMTWQKKILFCLNKNEIYLVVRVIWSMTDEKFAKICKGIFIDSGKCVFVCLWLERGKNLDKMIYLVMNTKVLNILNEYMRSLNPCLQFGISGYIL